MKILFLFLDGVGLGEDNPTINPFVQASMPNLEALLGGYKLITDGHFSVNESNFLLVNSERASLLSLDACLGVEGIPQSATGQATLLTGMNVPAMLGLHDGPKPNKAIIDLISRGTMFTQMNNNGRNSMLLNAYPPRYFKSIETGYRLPGVIALAVNQAGIQLKTMDDLNQGNAISADFTAIGWRERLEYLDIPLLNYTQAGKRLNDLANKSDLSIFEYWLTDMAGHHQDMQAACSLLGIFDSVLGSLLNSWDDENGLIILSSDHGNLEDLSTRHHTRNDVPLLMIGSCKLRELFLNQLNLSWNSRAKPDLTDIAPAIVKFIS